MVLVNDKQFQMRASAEFIAKLDKWRRAQPDIPGRSEAIRRLVEIGLGEHAPSAIQPAAVESQAVPGHKGSFLALFRKHLTEGGQELRTSYSGEDDTSVDDIIFSVANEYPSIWDRAEELLGLIADDKGEDVDKIRAMLEPFMDAPPKRPKPPRRTRSKKRRT